MNILKYQIKYVLFFLPLIMFSAHVYADCGKVGEISQRLKSCEEHEANKINPFMKVVSSINGQIYLYSEKEDFIISPVFENGSGKCLRPYKKVPQKDVTSASSFRCVLKDASRYILIENEVGL